MKDAVINELLINGLDGYNGHLQPEKALEGLDAVVAGTLVDNAPYTIWQLIGHINFWQEIFLARLQGKKSPPVLRAADGWPKEKAPADENVLDEGVQYLKNSIRETKTLLLNSSKLYYSDDYSSGYDVIRAMGNHLSYHIGQIMMLRRILGNYPPPSGGDTW